jgi:hypothetical protein
MRNDYKIRPRSQMLRGGGIAMKGMGQAFKKGGMAKKKSFPDLNKDGKVTKADIITARMSSKKKGKMMKGKR